MSTEEKDIRYQLADRLHSTAIHLLRRLRVQDLASGVGPAKLSALSVLVFGGRPLALAELAQAEQVKNPTMSRLVKDMEHDGLLRTRRSPEDARSILISPTELGRKLLLAGKKRRVESLADALKPLSRVELEQLQDSLLLLQEVVRRIQTAS
ncbi:MAG: MarR family transcriptional regulator [Acidobacteria bacterium]|nr:MarR family transcriptional regulator [Acidobacteriota bacterium]MBV9435161.1 MarR family transcriptional regulator [Acidobacteriota bacterium]